MNPEWPDWTAIGAVATAAGAVATALAALATLASAGFIAWQVYLTRRTVEDAEASLQIAQQQFREAQKARIDAEMPNLKFSIGLQYNVGTPTGGGYLSAIAPGTVFRATSLQPIAVSVQVEIVNESSRRVELTLTAAQGIVANRTRVTISAGESKTYPAIIERPVAEWVAEAHAWELARRQGIWPQEQVLMHARYTLASDFGADEIHTIVMAGSVLQRSANPDEWEVAPGRENYDHTLIEEKPFLREYYESRRRGMRIE